MADSGYVKLKEIKPALAGYVSEAHELIRHSAVPDEGTVHDVRVLMKKARATVRLLESQISDELFLKENDSFREIGRLLTVSRETAVQRKTLKLLRKENKELFLRLSENDKVNKLLEKHEYIETEDERAKVSQLDALLGKAVARIRFYKLDNLDPHVLLRQLEKSFSTASAAYLDCRFRPRANSLHELRKRSKDLLYQLYFFRPLNHSMVRQLENRLETLTQNLGKSNDLSQLLILLEYMPGSAENSDDINELAVIIKNRQDEFLEKIWPQAFRIFCPGRQLVNLLGFKQLRI